MLHTFRLACLVSLGMVAALQMGCKQSDTTAESAAAVDDHDHGAHDHDLTFAQAIGQIEQLSTTINDAMAKDDTDTAHDPLHEIGHILEELPHLAEHEALTADQQQAIKGAATTLLDSYGAVDAVMHGDEGKSWDEVKGEIDAALQVLHGFDHDHDHDHEHAE